jgi:outer membrane lipoprotein-sorting protein
MEAEKKIVALCLIFSVSLLIAPLYPSVSAGELKGTTGKGNLSDRPEKGDKHHYSVISDLLLYLRKQTSSISTIKTDFVQEKDLAIFKKKIALKGRIYLQKPYRIAWHVDEPIKYTVLITDKFIRQWDEDTDEVQEISISGNNIFRNVIDQLTVWFSGNYISLLENYDVRIRKQFPYVLEFIPKEKSIVNKVMKSITVMFREDARYLKQIEFQEISGDSTVIILENTVLNAPLDDNYFIIKPLKKMGWILLLPCRQDLFCLT